MTTKLERQDSVISILSSGIDLCRICHCDSSCGELISPCYCSGSMRWVHQTCLQHWIRASNNKACELCRYPYAMRTRLKPLHTWDSLPMSASEKRRLFCSALFHLIALACVIWSLYVLIDRSIEEVTQSELEWQFWTKIVVEAIGCLGAGILIYVWGKSYFSIVNKWIAFNRTFIVVSSSPPPIKKPMPSSGGSGVPAELPPCKMGKRPPVLTPTPTPTAPHPHQLPVGGMSYPHPENQPQSPQSYSEHACSAAASCSGSSSPLMAEGQGQGQSQEGQGHEGSGDSISDHENGTCSSYPNGGQYATATATTAHNDDPCSPDLCDIDKDSFDKVKVGVKVKAKSKVTGKHEGEESDEDEDDKGKEEGKALLPSYADLGDPDLDLDPQDRSHPFNRS